MKAISLCDANNFYVSCERLFQPKLNGRPVVVLSNNDGCVVSRSNEAKAIGIRMGEPLFEVRDLVNRHNVAALSSNYELYGDLSHRMMCILEDFSPTVERYSIDEGFAELEGDEGGELERIGREIRWRIKRWIGIPVSIGIAETKTLAKLAARRAKTMPELDGVLDVTAAADLRQNLLEQTPVKQVWGIGPRWSKMLRERKIETAAALAQADDRWIRARMSVVGLRVVHELRGIECLPVEDCPPPKLSIASTRSFPGRVEAKEDLQAALALFVTRAGEKLRREGQVAAALNVFIRTNKFSGDEQYTGSITLALAPLSNSTLELQALAFKGLDAIYRPGFGYKKAGVMLTGLQSVATVPQRLWDNKPNEKMKVLMEAVDGINGRFGRETVKVGVFTSDGKWKMRQEHRSPRCTTRWNELRKAKTE